MSKNRTLLLSSVFGPYGVDDEFGRKENIMELFHNQVTREQGIFSLRMNHESGGLHLIAENISIPTVVLDFPSQDRFIKEIKKGYEYVGISFIVPNFVKAKQMAELIRLYTPQTKIILGGHGTAIENIEKLIPCDYVCRGEGVRFMRALFKDDVNAPINHPILHSSFNKHVMGATWKDNAAVILPGAGCQNSCRFCSTSHYFQQYTSFFSTGKEIFQHCVKLEERLGAKEFFLMDENFLKSETRAQELLQEMEKHGKAYSFGIFSSAEAVMKIGIDFIERLGINFLWMGVESKKEVYEKNKGVDFKRLIKGLRDRGVSVLASGILFSEHHTKKTIYEDVDFIVSLNADFVQFMQLGPLPGTALYKDYDEQDKLLKNIPYEEWHGQHKIWFKHPHFTEEESEKYLRAAFKRDFYQNGPSILRMLDTTIRGVICSRDYTSLFMQKRHKQKADRAWNLYPLLEALCLFAPDKHSKYYAYAVRSKYDNFFGKKTFSLRLKSLAVLGFAIKEKIRASLVQNNMRQPKTKVTEYRMIARKEGRIKYFFTVEAPLFLLRTARSMGIF